MSKKARTTRCAGCFNRVSIESTEMVGRRRYCKDICADRARTKATNQENSSTNQNWWQEARTED